MRVRFFLNSVILDCGESLVHVFCDGDCIVVSDGLKYMRVVPFMIGSFRSVLDSIEVKF